MNLGVATVWEVPSNGAKGRIGKPSWERGRLSERLQGIRRKDYVNVMEELCAITAVFKDK
jgi:hypothetical protein